MSRSKNTLFLLLALSFFTSAKAQKTVLFVMSEADTLLLNDGEKQIKTQ